MIISKEQIDIILNGLQNCIFDELTFDTCHKDILEHLDQTVFSLSYEWGCTKLVLMPRNCNFVVKIPFYGDMLEKKNGTYIQQFSGAKEPEGWNYCEAESILYTHAEEKEVEKYFLETYCIGFVHEYPIYVQELAVVLNEAKPCYRELSDEEIARIEKVREFCRKKNTKRFDITWIADFIDYYGEEAWIKLDKFLHDFYITDLHSENIGYNSAGAPVIMDYAGYSS